MGLASMVFLFIFGYGSALAAPTALTITAHRQYAFADHLFQKGEYRRAAEEYQRFIFFFPAHELRRKAEFQTAEAYRLAGDLATAIKYFQPLTRFSGAEPDPISVDAYFMLSETYLRMRAEGQALLQLRNIITLCDKIGILDKAYYRMGWIFAGQGDWHGAKRAWNLISAQGRYPKQRLLKAAGEDMPQIPKKSPSLAGTLSVIPGMGQLYLGRGHDALVAFVITGGTVWAAYEAFDNELPVLGVMLSMVGAGFYAGNIYSAVSGAHKYNHYQIQQFSTQLRQELDAQIPHKQEAGRHDAGMGMQFKINF
jgi:tetratricopeptide (TPR) repeat protein